MADEGRVLRRTGQWRFLLVVWAGFPLLGLAGLSAAHGTGERLFALAIFVVSGLVWVRLLVVELRTDDGGVLVRGMFRTRRVPWEEVDSARAVPANLLSIAYIVEIRRHEGRPIRADGVGNWRFRAAVDQLPVGEMASYIDLRANESA